MCLRKTFWGQALCVALRIPCPRPIISKELSPDGLLPPVLSANTMHFPFSFFVSYLRT